MLSAEWGRWSADVDGLETEVFWDEVDVRCAF